MLLQYPNGVSWLQSLILCVQCIKRLHHFNPDISSADHYIIRAYLAAAKIGLNNLDPEFRPADFDEFVADVAATAKMNGGTDQMIGREDAPPNPLKDGRGPVVEN